MTHHASWNAFAIAVAMLGLTAATHAVTVTYDGLNSSSFIANETSTDLSYTYGDALNMTSGGTLEELSFTLFNALPFQPTGAILAGDFEFKFYDNSSSYFSGPVSALPLLGSFTTHMNFGPGLNPGGLAYITSTFLSSYNINLTSNVLITQSFTQTAGASTRYGVGLFSAPSIGTNGSGIFMSGASTPDGMYPSGGRVGYRVSVVPEPATFAALGLGVVGLMRRRRA